MFFCPGCHCGHGVWVHPHRNGKSGTWSFNGDMEKPTFNPSLLVSHDTWTPPVTLENMEEYRMRPWPQTKIHHICHSFVREGMIQFLGDCTHELKGQTVPLPDF